MQSQQLKKRSDTPPIVDRYGEYKTDSQLFFTDKLEESKHCSLWLTVIFIILTWNTFIVSLQTNPPILHYIDYNQTHEIPALGRRNLMLGEIKTIPHFRGDVANSSYQNDLKHEVLSEKTNKQGFNISLNSRNHSKRKKYNKYLFSEKNDRFRQLRKESVQCGSTYFKILYIFAMTDIIIFTSLGILADIYGRRKCMVFTVPVYTIGYILKQFVTTNWMLCIFTAVARSSLQSATYIGIILLLEIVDSEIRSFMVIFVWVGFSIGSFLKHALSIHFALSTAKILQRVIISTLLLPICTQWLLPESPHWLLCHRDWKKMAKLLYEMNYPKPLGIAEEMYQHSQPSPLTSLKQIINTLLKPVFRRKILLGGFLYSLTYLLYFTESFRIVVAVKTKFSLIEGTAIIINIAVVPILLRRISRPMLICSSLLILALFYSASTMTHGNSGADLVIANICFFFAENAIITNGLLIVETFPTRVRCSAISICRSVGTIWIIVSTIIKEFTTGTDAMGRYELTIYGALMLVAAFLCIFVNDTGNVPLPDTEMQAIIHF